VLFRSLRIARFMPPFMITGDTNGPELLPATDTNRTQVFIAATIEVIVRQARPAVTSLPD